MSVGFKSEILQVFCSGTESSAIIVSCPLSSRYKLNVTLYYSAATAASLLSSNFLKKKATFFDFSVLK